MYGVGGRLYTHIGNVGLYSETAANEHTTLWFASTVSSDRLQRTFVVEDIFL